MSLNHSPRIVTEGLILCLDSGNIKSFPGEPTTNIVPSPTNNGRFTTSNTWSTYNTNHYNGGAFFSIGTISSVSNNIVTTSSAHTLLSFDVMRPQTTGGGLTANTDYVVKRISSTEFSLHSYNSSQDGSQGYTNTATGFFKVHDAYATDTRISVNSTDFPTMWWGAPHLPNSGLIKEIVPNGGIVSGTNCMRLHVYRGDGVVDGMAYGVYPHVTVGDVITVSVYVRTTNNNGVGKNLGLSTYFGPGQPGPGGSINMGAVGVWQRAVYTWTAPATYDFILYWWPEGSSSIYSIDMADLQVEINKGGRATTFTTGTRGATPETGGGMLDLSGNGKHHTLISSPGEIYDPRAMTFDGSTQGIQYSGSLTSATNCTVVIIYKTTDGTELWVMGVDGNWYLSASSGNNYYHNNCGSPENYVDLVRVYNPVTEGYRNGNYHMWEAKNVDFSAWTIFNWFSYSGVWHMEGTAAYIMVYNRVLSAAESAQNFKALRGRFGF